MALTANYGNIELTKNRPIMPQLYYYIVRLQLFSFSPNKALINRYFVIQTMKFCFKYIFQPSYKTDAMWLNGNYYLCPAQSINLLQEWNYISIGVIETISCHIISLRVLSRNCSVYMLRCMEGNKGIECLLFREWMQEFSWNWC